MIDATKPGIRALGQCNGWQPWLGPNVFEPCDVTNQMLVHTASNAYFPQTMSVISLPDRDELVARAVDPIWEHYLQYVEDIDDLIRERRRKPRLRQRTSTWAFWSDPLGSPDGSSNTSGHDQTGRYSNQFRWASRDHIDASRCVKAGRQIRSRFIPLPERMNLQRCK